MLPQKQLKKKKKKKNPTLNALLFIDMGKFLSKPHLKITFSFQVSLKRIHTLKKNLILLEKYCLYYLYFWLISSGKLLSMFSVVGIVLGTWGYRSYKIHLPYSVSDR